MTTGDTLAGPAPTVVRPHGDFYAPVSCGHGYLQCSRTELRYFGGSLNGLPDHRAPIEELGFIELWIPVNMHRSEKSNLIVGLSENDHNPLVIDPVGILQWPAVLDLLATVVLTSNDSPLRHINGALEAWNWEEGRVETDEALGVVNIHTFTGKGRQTDPRQRIAHNSLRCVGARLRRNGNPTMMLVTDEQATDEQAIELSGYESFILLSHISSLVSMGIRK